MNRMMYGLAFIVMGVVLGSCQVQSTGSADLGSFAKNDSLKSASISNLYVPKDSVFALTIDFSKEGGGISEDVYNQIPFVPLYLPYPLLKLSGNTFVAATATIDPNKESPNVNAGIQKPILVSFFTNFSQGYANIFKGQIKTALSVLSEMKPDIESKNKIALQLKTKIENKEVDGFHVEHAAESMFERSWMLDAAQVDSSILGTVLIGSKMEQLKSLSSPLNGKSGWDNAPNLKKLYDQTDPNAHFRFALDLTAKKEWLEPFKQQIDAAPELMLGGAATATALKNLAKSLEGVYGSFKVIHTGFKLEIGLQTSDANTLKPIQDLYTQQFKKDFANGFLLGLNTALAASSQATDKPFWGDPEIVSQMTLKYPEPIMADIKPKLLESFRTCLNQEGFVDQIFKLETNNNQLKMNVILDLKVCQSQFKDNLSIEVANWDQLVLSLIKYIPQYLRQSKTHEDQMSAFMKEYDELVSKRYGSMGENGYDMGDVLNSIDTVQADIGNIPGATSGTSMSTDEIQDVIHSIEGDKEPNKEK